MTGNFTRDTSLHGRARSYSRLHLQQGRVLLDADWNEQVDRERELARQAAADTIGHGGVPRARPGFRVSPGGAGGFTLGAGRLWADGVLVELAADVPVAAQPFGSATMADVAEGTRALVYLAADERTVTSLDDPRLLEMALGGPDTTTRVQTTWKVEVVAVAATGLTEAQIRDLVERRRPLDLPQWARSTGRLTARASVAAVVAEGRPCRLPPTAGYSDQRNSLYRVEIHRGGDQTVARYKWSRRNASVRGRLEQQGAALALVGREANELITAGSWVEVQTPDQHRLGRPGSLARITFAPDGSPIFAADLAPGGAVDGSIVTLWDHPAGASAHGIAVHTQPALLEAGVEVEFAAGTYHAGDYWLIPARADTNDIEWPPHEGGPSAVGPFNRGSWFVPLALVTRRGGAAADVVDLRVEFPLLTDIRATDVSYDDTRLDIEGAENVQEALERLARRSSGGCTFHATPDLGWERVFDQIRPGEHGEVCLDVGEYLLADVLKVADKGHVTVSGRGRGTHIVAPTVESAVQFVRCASVTVQNLRISAGTSKQVVRRSGRNGALECRDCGPVTIESVHARARSHVPRSVACVSIVRSARAAWMAMGRGDVTIRDCTLEGGLQQIGIQVVNARRATIVGNTVFPQAMEGAQVWEAFRRTRSLRREVADLLVAQRRPSTEANRRGDPDMMTIRGGWSAMSLELDGHRLEAVVENGLTKSLTTYLEVAGPAGVEHPGALSAHLRNAVMEAIVSGGVVHSTSRNAGGGPIAFELLGEFVGAVRNALHTHLSQGIVVGGDEAGTLELHGNEVYGAIQGIHVGLSHAGQRGRDRDVAQRVRIGSNSISVAVLPLARARHAIFCGNAESILVDDNVVRRIRPSADVLRRVPVNGIHLHGAIGPFAVVKNNDVRGCSTGVRFFAEPRAKGAPLWLVEDNLLESAVHAVEIRPGIEASVTRHENNRTG